MKRWPNLTFWLGLPSEIIDGLVDTLDTLRKDGKIGNKVAMAAVGDQFGIEQSTAAREGFKKAGFELVYDKSYPFGTQDLQPIVKDAQARKSRHLRRIQLSAGHDRPHRSVQDRRLLRRRSSSSASAPRSRCSSRSSAQAPKA